MNEARLRRASAAILLMLALAIGATGWMRSERGVPADSPRRMIDVNTDGAPALELLPRIGPTMASRIVEDRERNGRFESVEALDRVHGIGEKTVARLRDFVGVD